MLNASSPLNSSFSIFFIFIPLVTWKKRKERNERTHLPIVNLFQMHLYISNRFYKMRFTHIHNLPIYSHALEVSHLINTKLWCLWKCMALCAHATKISRWVDRLWCIPFIGIPVQFFGFNEWCLDGSVVPTWYETWQNQKRRNEKKKRKIKQKRVGKNSIFMLNWWQF